MPNTFSDISIQAVFAVKHRESLILSEWRGQLHSYISGILTRENIKALAVGGWLDHVHIFFGLPPARNISDIIRIVKANSSKWVNERRFVSRSFEWQHGYGAFSYSNGQRNHVIRYIMEQEQHHKKLTFQQEYLRMPEEFNISCDNRYLFQFYQ